MHFDQIFGTGASHEDLSELLKRGDLQDLIAVSLKRSESCKYSNIEDQMRKALLNLPHFATTSQQIIDATSNSPSMDEEEGGD